MLCIYTTNTIRFCWQHSCKHVCNVKCKNRKACGWCLKNQGSDQSAYGSPVIWTLEHSSGQDSNSTPEYRVSVMPGLHWAMSGTGAVRILWHTEDWNSQVEHVSHSSTEGKLPKKQNVTKYIWQTSLINFHWVRTCVGVWIHTFQVWIVFCWSKLAVIIHVAGKKLIKLWYARQDMKQVYWIDTWLNNND